MKYLVHAQCLDIKRVEYVEADFSWCIMANVIPSTSLTYNVLWTLIKNLLAKTVPRQLPWILKCPLIFA